MTDSGRTEGGYRPGYEVAAEQVLELIAQLRLRPGDRMPTENELAQQLGTSRTVVREAIKILSALGRVRAQKGAVSTSPTTRGCSAPAVGRPSSCPPTWTTFTCSSSSAGHRRWRPAGWPRIALRPPSCAPSSRPPILCREGFDTGREDLFDQGDEAFHATVADASNNMFLQIAVREARRLQAQSSIIGLRGSIGGHAAKAVEEHEAIYQAIRAGDPEAAAHAAASHIDNTLSDYRQEIQQRIFSEHG